MSTTQDKTTEDLQRANAVLRQELDAALAQKAALAEVLDVINRSPGDPGPVFEAILDKAHSLCAIAVGALVLYDGESTCTVATRGYPAEHAAVIGQRRRPGSLTEALIRGERLTHVVDLQAHQADPDHEVLRNLIERRNVRTGLQVPLRKDGTLLGFISAYRLEVRPFVEKDIALLENFAAQAVIAIENARLITETREALEQQTATAEVLQVINTSPGNLTPVFDTILEKAHSLCGAVIGALVVRDGESFRAVATRGLPDNHALLLRRGFGVNTYSRRLLEGERVVHIPDVRVVDAGDSEAARGLAENTNVRTSLWVPLRKDGILLGFTTAMRVEVRLFSEKEITLLESFAAQAVIAMENARLLGELRQRTGDLQESLEYQTATSDVLKVISQSTFDLPPVLETLLETAARLCDADLGTISIREGDAYRVTANYNSLTPEYDAFFRGRLMTVDRESITGRTALEGRTIHVSDVLSDPEFTLPTAKLGGARTVLGVPLLREGAVAGVIILARKPVKPFTDRQIELVTTFADQAVIAIENTRLLTEQREALEQQTATAEVLQVINASPGDLAPVFDAMLEKALRLCDAAFGNLWTYNGEVGRLAAICGASPEYRAELMRAGPQKPEPGGSLIRLVEGEPLVHIADITAEGAHHSGATVRRMLGDRAGARTVLWVPMRKDGALLGFFTIYRTEVRPFTNKQISLLQNFAVQAVIAMENARLLTETREALDQQTATAEVLQVINSSPGDLAPVFEAVLEKAMRLCGATFGSLYTYDGERFHSAAQRGVPAAYAELREKTPPSGRSGGPGTRILQTKCTVHILDMRLEEAYQTGQALALAGSPLAGVQALVELGGARTILGVPLLKDAEVRGYISIYRQEVRAFSEKQIALLENFAAQAVIAMENARLLGELQERTEALATRNSEYGERIEQQGATIDVLKVMSGSPGDARPVFELIVERARSFCGADHATMALLRDDMLHLEAYSGMSAAFRVEYAAQFPRPVDTSTMFGRAILSREVIQTGNLQADRDHLVRHMIHLDFHSIVGVPLLREGTPIGAIALGRQAPGGFTDSQVALLQTFAEQAVIAITSAETYRALQNRTAELSRSVAELQALEEVLRAVNSSLDLDTVLATIISRAVQLSQADEGTIYEFNAAEEVFVPRSAYGMTEERVAALRERKIRLGETHLGRAALQRAPVHVADVQQDPMIADAGGLLRGIHAVLAVPLMWDEKVVGGLVIRRRTVGGFAPSIPTLLQTFAGQAVLAIENAELFQEARRARTAAEATLTDLRRTQDRLVQTEKMASLGQLTAGIAHEIKNPLNFVNNFSDLSVDLLAELHEAVAPDRLAVAADLRAEIDDLTTTLKGNLEKIAQHGRRADSIVKNMLLHSRTGPSEHRAIDLNATVEEALNLAFHGARAETPGFSITMEKDLDPKAAAIDAFPQEFLRVMLNLINNGFYAARKHAAETTDPGFEPTIRLTTRDLGDQVEIRVRDNGIGIPIDIRDKLFQPFFTTKPTGEGTGLGLSISYDIVTQQHGGTITVDSQVGDYTEFVVTLPRRMFVNDGGGA